MAADPRVRAIESTAETAIGLLSGGVVDLNGFGTKLVQHGFLESTALDGILDTLGFMPADKARKLWNTVQAKVKADPSKFDKLKEILEEYRPLDALLTRINEEHSKFALSVNSFSVKMHVATVRLSVSSHLLLYYKHVATHQSLSELFVFTTKP